MHNPSPKRSQWPGCATTEHPLSLLQSDLSWSRCRKAAEAIRCHPQQYTIHAAKPGSQNVHLARCTTKGHIKRGSTWHHDHYNIKGRRTPSPVQSPQLVGDPPSLLWPSSAARSRSTAYSWIFLLATPSLLHSMGRAKRKCVVTQRIREELYVALSAVRQRRC